MAEAASDEDWSGDDRLLRYICANAELEGDGSTDNEAATSTTKYSLPHSSWTPRALAFGEYRRSEAARGRSSGVAPLRARLSKEIVAMYRVCNPSFQYSESENPKRYLTDPSVGVFNDGADNEHHELILYFGQVLSNNDNTRRYVVKDIIGSGVNGQVVKCLTLETNLEVAVKIIKKADAYFEFLIKSRFEIGILHTLNRTFDKGDEHHVVRSFEHFSYKGHLCIVFELLGPSLFEILKINSFRGFSLPLVRTFVAQLLDALTLLYDAGVIHCDLKPENILLKSVRTPEIKLIDFGSSCMTDQVVYTYIQSRFYRAPEVVLGHAYSTAIDMWSLGCVAAEFFFGLPLFPGQCAYDLLLYMIEKLGKQPPDHILRNSKNTNKYFMLISAAPHTGKDSTISAYRFLTPIENAKRENQNPARRKHYLPGSLEEMITNFPMKSAGKEETEKEMFNRKVFVDFLRGVLEVDPSKRWTAYEALQHPFITEGPFTGPFNPRKEVPHSPEASLLFLGKGSLTGPSSSTRTAVPAVRIVGFDLQLRKKVMPFSEHSESCGHEFEELRSQVSQLPHRGDGTFSSRFSPGTDAVPRALTSLGLGIEINVSSEFRRSFSPRATRRSVATDERPHSSTKEEKKHVFTSPGPTETPCMKVEGAPKCGNIVLPQPRWPLSLYICFSDFLLLLCIFLEPLSNIWISLTDQVRHLVGFLVQFFRIYIFERYGKQLPSRHKWRVNSRDLKTNRFVGQGCSGIVYETTWSGREIMGVFARKDFPAVQSDVFENEAACLVELGDHPNIVKSLCWTIDRRSCSLVMEYVRYDLYSVVQKRKGEQRNDAASDDTEHMLTGITSPFELNMSISIILKIAIGMRYLHSRKIAHGDLKPSNILIDSEESPSSVKVADFGLINTKRSSTTLVSYRAHYLQIVKWKAPELFNKYLGPSTLNLETGSDTDSHTVKMSNDSTIKIFRNAGLRRADIYSFALTCSHILGVQNWDPNMTWVELRKFILRGLRPQLPSACPASLSSLISSCWAADPLSRPTFHVLCKQLNSLKSEQMRHVAGHQIYYPVPRPKTHWTDKFKKDMKRRSVNVSRTGRRCKTVIPR